MTSLSELLLFFAMDDHISQAFIYYVVFRNLGTFDWNN